MWTITRILLVAFTGVTALPHSVWDASAADLRLYQEWAELIVRHHTFPLADEQWQYPPGAGALLVVPWLFGGGAGYNWFFFGVVAVADAAVLGLLIRAAERGGGSRYEARCGAPSFAGPWVWTVGVALLGRVCYGRFDLVVAACAVAALVWAGRRPVAAGVAVAAGVLLKVWPVVAVLGLRRRELRRVGVAAGAAGVVLAGGVTLLGPGAWSFLRFQAERGLQIESAAATPLLIARLVSGGWVIEHRFGAEELSGPGVAGLARVCVVVMVVGGVVVLAQWWRVRPPAADLALAATLLAMVTSRVLSPQYVVWAVAVAAVCALRSRTTQRPIVYLVLVAAFLSQVEFPFVYDRVATGSLPGVVVLTLRNAVLVGAAVWSVVRLRHGRSTGYVEARSSRGSACPRCRGRARSRGSRPDGAAGIP